MSFSSKEISALLSETGYTADVAAFSCTTSTNDIARSLVKKTYFPVIVVADQQTKGKGSHGRTFFSPGDTGFYMTFSVPEADPAMQMTLAAGVASVQAIYEVYCREVGIKWVNDLIYDGRKVSGILCERMSDGTVLVGIGINIMMPKEGFPSDIADTASVLGADPRRVNRLAVSIYTHFMDLIEHRDRILPMYRENCITLGKKIRFTYEGEEQYGLASDVDEDGSLIIVQDGISRKFSSGEISVRAI